MLISLNIIDAGCRPLISLPLSADRRRRSRKSRNCFHRREDSFQKTEFDQSGDCTSVGGYIVAPFSQCVPQVCGHPPAFSMGLSVIGMCYIMCTVVAAWCQHCCMETPFHTVFPLFIQVWMFVLPNTTKQASWHL